MKKILVMIMVGIFVAAQVAFAATPNKVNKAVQHQAKAATITHTITLTSHMPTHTTVQAPKPAAAKIQAAPKPVFKAVPMTVQAPKPSAKTSVAAVKSSAKVQAAPGSPTTKREALNPAANKSTAAVKSTVKASATVKNNLKASPRTRPDAKTMEINRLKQEATKNYIESIKNFHAAIPGVYLVQTPVK